MYPSSTEEAGALRRAATRAECRVRSLRVVDGRVRSVLECRDGWGAARLLVALGAEDRTAPWARELAAEIRRGAPSDAAYAQAVLDFVKGHLRFVREAPGAEMFQSGPYSLLSGEGDCEDHARLVYALAMAGGLPARFAFLHKGGGPTHAVAQVVVDGETLWAETTIDARLGEHPIAAGRRLGILSSRGDITEGVRVMTEKDLRPVPPGFVAANNPAQVQRDAQALVRLGFLCDDDASGMQDPTDPRFRRAVLEFQKKSGITPDGLVGPQTRRTLAGALPLDEFGMGYVAATSIPPNPRMVHAWPIMLEAAQAFGIESRDSVAILLAISWFETQYGNPALRWEDSNNWGGVTYVAGRGEPFVSWGYLEHGDTYEGRPVVYKFQRYPSALEGAKDAVRVKLSGGKRRAAGGGEELRQALLSANVEGVAAAMFDNGYYTGTHLDVDRDGQAGTREDKILAYANAIRGSLPAVRASAPAGTSFGGGGNGGGFVVAGLLALLVGGAAFTVLR